MGSVSPRFRLNFLSADSTDLHGGSLQKLSPNLFSTTVLNEAKPMVYLKILFRPNFLLTNAAGDTIHSTAHEAHEQLVGF